MNRPLALLLTWLLVTLAACAADPVDGPRAGQRYAVIETGDSRKTDGIFPVLITEIDGRNYNTSPDALSGAGSGFVNGRTHFRVDPGTHEIKALAIVDTDYAPGLTRDLSRPSNTLLKYNFQSGMRYFIGLKAAGPRRSDWQLVVWKAEEMAEGTLDFGDN